ncbi:transposase [Streptomyces sp. NBC_01017]|uniref:IS1634 family transposase n=1 Tax=Streptomyces sp. NBC_01017 TaxID=2903721 RepID=UPI00386BBCA3|nr:transposase [Streptomyces sp. NBC_01017]WSV34998.1 transposase [Streptomyces sp. NBC_01017]
MDLPIEGDAQGAVQEAVFFAAAHLLNPEVDLIFSDTTSTCSSATARTQRRVMRRFAGPGHSKDHRKDLPQIDIEFTVTRESIRVRCWVWPGNTSDTTVIGQGKDDLLSWRLGRVVTVADSGYSSEANLAYLTRAGGHYITGLKIRETSKKAAAALARQGRYQELRDNLRVKEVQLDDDPGRRWIIYHNPVEAAREQARRDEQLSVIVDELERIPQARSSDAKKARTRRPRPPSAP